MAKKKPRAKSRAKFSGETVALNPWIPAIPVKGVKGKAMLKLVLSIPLVLTAGTVSGEPLPHRTLEVPVELTRQGLTLKEFEKQVLSLRGALLDKYEARIILVQKGGK